MIAVFADTHRRAGHGLTDRAVAAASDASVILHAGDFITEAVLEAFDTLGEFHGVAGNNDPPGIQRRLPSETVVEAEGARIAMVHGHEHSEQALSLLGRDREVDVVVSGHSHRPRVLEVEGVTLLNPGSHAQPRQFTPGYAELRVRGSDGEGRIVNPGDGIVESFRFGVEGRSGDR